MTKGLDLLGCPMTRLFSGELELRRAHLLRGRGLGERERDDEEYRARRRDDEGPPSSRRLSRLARDGPGEDDVLPFS